MAETGPNLNLRPMTAGADIKPATVVRLDYTQDFGVVPAVTGDFPYGIAQEWTSGAPGTPYDDGYAANAGEQIMIYGPGSIARAAAKRTSDNISAGRPVGPSSTSEIIGVTSGPAVGWLLESGTANKHQRLRVQVFPHVVGGNEGSGS